MRENWMVTYQGGCLDFHLVCVHGCGGAVVLGADLEREEGLEIKDKRREEKMVGETDMFQYFSPFSHD